MSPTSYQAALPRVIPSLLSATLIIIPYSNGFVKRVRKVFLQRKQRMKTRLPTFFPESQQPRQFTPLREGRRRLPCDSGSTFKFQFTPLREGRPIPGRNSAAPIIFQFTPLREGRLQALCSESVHIHFNSRPSARGDQELLRLLAYIKISIHAPPRGATSRTRRRARNADDFNSRPSARGDRHASGQSRDVDISIHAPPRGATVRHALADDVGDISIHAPPRGATRTASRRRRLPPNFNLRPSARGDPTLWRRRTLLMYFNSRPSARGDMLSMYNRCSGRYISIHAPPRGATRMVLVPSDADDVFQFTPLREGRPPSVWKLPQSHYFNSRPSARGDTKEQMRTHSMMQFQFTPLREGRPRLPNAPLRLAHFNSRPSARGDRDENAFSPPDFISIHAPPRGATLVQQTVRDLHLISIHLMLMLISF